MTGWLGSVELTAMFEDVAPVEQDEGPHSVVPISYPEEYRHLMNVFRAILRSGERSPRVLELTACLVEHNAAHYTVWHVRRECLFALAAEGDTSSLVDELAYVENVAGSNPKNYQIWYHRRVLLEHVGAGSARAELDFIATMLAGDAKNYHGWAHRLWLVTEFGVYDGELAFLDGLVRQDPFNNSAWSHRHAVVAATEDSAADDVAAREVAYAIEFCEAQPENESPWFYALSFARRSARAEASLRAHCEEAIKARPSPFAASTLLELYEATAADSQALDYAQALAYQLASVLDPPRRAFWNTKASRLQERIDHLRGRPPTPPPIPALAAAPPPPASSS